MPSTLTRTMPFGVVDSLLSATVGSWTSMTRAGFDYWSGALARKATPYELTRDFGSWMTAMATRERPEWAHEHTVLKEWPIARLRDYSTADADPSMVATILLPPQAGHDSSIVDYSPAQSQIMTARDNGCHRVLSFDWVGATQETRDTTIDDYMQVMREAIELVGGKANLVGDCQGGWLATIFAALHPEMINSLAIAGAPIDFHAGEPLIRDWVEILAPNGDMTFYRTAVESNDGLLPGTFLLHGFMALQPDQELDRQLQLLANMHDPAHTERYHRFENWFQWTQALPGEFYLWVVEHLFAKNELVKGELVVGGRTVDLAAIDAPLFLMAGETDHITPAPQVWALAEHASTPADKVGRQSSTGGHLGLFMGREALEKHWSVIFAEMAALSHPETPEPAELTDEPTGKGEFVVGTLTEVPVTEPAPTEPATARTVAAAKTAPRARRTVAKRVPAKKTAAPSAKLAPKTASTKTATPAKKTPAPAAKSAAPASKSAPATKSAPTPAAKSAAPAAKSAPVPAAKSVAAKTTAAPAKKAPAPTAKSAPAPAAKSAAPAAKSAPATKSAASKTATAPAKKAPAPAAKKASAPAPKSAASVTKSAPAPATESAPAPAAKSVESKTAATPAKSAPATSAKKAEPAAKSAPATGAKKAEPAAKSPAPATKAAPAKAEETPAKD